MWITTSSLAPQPTVGWTNTPIWHRWLGFKVCTHRCHCQTAHWANPHPDTEGLIRGPTPYKREGYFHRLLTVLQSLTQMKMLGIKKQHSFSYLVLSTSSFLFFFLHLLATSPTLLGQCGLHSLLAWAAKMRVKSIYVQFVGRGWDRLSLPGRWQP